MAHVTYRCHSGSYLVAAQKAAIPIHRFIIKPSGWPSCSSFVSVIFDIETPIKLLIKAQAMAVPMARRSLGEWDSRVVRTYVLVMTIPPGWYHRHMTAHRIYAMPVASVYPLYVQKALKKGRTKVEVDEIIRWLTGYSADNFEKLLIKKTNFEAFFAEAPGLNPLRRQITGVVCGVRVEEIADPLMQEIRYLDKLIDELAKGKSMDKILRRG